MLKLGSHVGMSGKEMFLGSVKEALSYGANTFMVYTGAPQNTRRKEISELNIEAGLSLAREHGISEFIVLHPGSHVGAGEKAGIAQIVKGLNLVLTKETPITVALETMAGKGSELGKTFEELAAIYDGVIQNDKLRVCFDTCHTHDAGYDIVHDFDGVIARFDRLIGKDQIAAFHINDSKNVAGAAKDRHENIGFGEIGFDALCYIVHHEAFTEVPKILETPYITAEDGVKEKTLPPYREEIAMLRSKQFHTDLISEIRRNAI